MKKDWVIWGDEIGLSANIIGEKHKHAKLIFEEIKNKSKVVISHPPDKKFLKKSSFLNQTKRFKVINFGKSLKKLLVITRGEKGAISINGDEVTECDIQKDLKIVDLTGAGDLFAAGFLHGHINGLSQTECLEKGTEMSSKVIQQIGARI